MDQNVIDDITDSRRLQNDNISSEKILHLKKYIKNVNGIIGYIRKHIIDYIRYIFLFIYQ